MASVVLILLMWQWRPLPATIRRIENEAGQWVLWGLFALGWLIVLASTYMISHAHLFGLKQVRQYLGRKALIEEKKG